MDQNQNHELLQQAPLAWALTAARNNRVPIIEEIERRTERRLLVYFASMRHPHSMIRPDDVVLFADLLHDVRDTDIDLMLQTGGGDPDTAEKLVYMCRQRAKGFRVIVPERAKSAGTLMALAADEIIMGETSELGPIDPFLTRLGEGGVPEQQSAAAYVKSVEKIEEKVNDRGGEVSGVEAVLLQGIDLCLLEECRTALARSRQFAVKHLTKHMFAKQFADHEDGEQQAEEKAVAVADLLLDTERYTSHGIVIDGQEAKDELGLTVDVLDQDDPTWQYIWRLYCLFEVECRASEVAKVFESSALSLVV